MRDVRIIVSLLALSVVLVPAAGAERTRGNAAALPDVEIPYETFTLENGLRVIVSTDRKAPVIAVGVWYGVGSRDEHPGITGFAHLFEHLMFNGSEHYNEDYFGPFERVGATDMNGTTWFDRTNYFQTVPATALEMTLWMESGARATTSPTGSSNTACPRAFSRPVMHTAGPPSAQWTISMRLRWTTSAAGFSTTMGLRTPCRRSLATST